MGPQPRRGWKAAATAMALLAGGGLGVWESVRAEPTKPAAVDSALRLDTAAIPDDPQLLAELEKAIDLRQREHFDRVLDAREPGELVEHATLTDSTLLDAADAALERMGVARPAPGGGPR